MNDPRRLYAEGFELGERERIALETENDGDGYGSSPGLILAILGERAAGGRY